MAIPIRYDTIHCIYLRRKADEQPA